MPIQVQTKAETRPQKRPSIPALRDAFLAKLPADLRTYASAIEHKDAVTLLWQMAGCARQVYEWTQYQPEKWTAPVGYEERLARVCAWLGRQEEARYPWLREDALKILLVAWEQHRADLTPTDAPNGISEQLYACMPSLWMPDEEFGPLQVHDQPLPFLPVWSTQDADPIRAKAARTCEEFTVYSALVTYFNLALGKEPFDVEPDPF